ncbi:MAG: signal peptidase II [Candidatus Stahlbacteria bacterium]|nr:signal peptidase II [candidate division WOR-3 bacterium]TEU01186.1 MAG: signal peptidase II [Candidatus Stahlbacteria bacterium]
MEKGRALTVKKKLPFLLISIAVLILDQWTKKLIASSMFLGESQRIIGDVVRFTYIRNPNSVFGLRLGGPIISTVLTVIAFLFVVYLFVVAKNPIFLTSISFIIGGALGNLVDRIFYMEVVDFIEIGVGRFRWPTFNMADSFVTIGIILVIIHWFLEYRYDNSSSNFV